MKKKIVALLLTLVMLVGIIPAAVYAAEEAETKVVLTVVPDKTVAMRGDTISFTVYMSTAEKLASMAFTTAFPEGFTYVKQSGMDSIPVIDPGTGDIKLDEDGYEVYEEVKTIMADAKKALGFDDIAWTEWTEMETPVEGQNFFNGYGSKTKAPKNEVALCEFKATVDADAELKSDYKLELVGLDEFSNLAEEVFDPEQIEVVSPEITVIDHVCADNLTAVEGKEADCDDSGVHAHFVCDKCGTKYADESASTVFEGDTIIAPKGHSDYEWVVVTPATCTAKGLEEYTCPDCGDVTDSREIDILPHTEGEWEVVTEADCTEKGLSELRCTVCDTLLDSKVVEAHGHDKGEWVVVSEGDCVTEGLKELRCTICGTVLKSEVTPPVGSHDYNAVVTDPTATEGGYTTYTCSRCGDSYVDDFTGKVEGKVVLTVANKNNTILTGIVNSDYTASISVPHGVTIDTNAVTVGLAMKDVASLGISGTKSFKKVLNTGVDKEVVFDNYIPTTFTDATVSGTIDGVAYKYEFAGVDTAEKFTITATPDAGVQPAWHALTSHIATAEKAADDSYAYVPNAAYVQIGEEKLVFENEYKLDNISSASADELRAAVTLYDVEALTDAQIKIFLPAGTVLALSNYEAELEDNATITIYGYKDSEAVNTIMSQLRACETTTDIIKTLVLFVGDVATAINGQDVTLNIDFCHEEGNVVVENEIAADCVNTGSYDEVVYCTICGEELKRETIPVAALGHVEEVDAAVEPTCTATGLTEGKHCSVCGEVLVAQEVVEKLAHEYATEVTEPTCTDAGFSKCTCKVCGDTHVSEYKEALGHTAGAEVIENMVEATGTTEGSYDKVVYCTVCDAELSRETVVIAKKVLPVSIELDETDVRTKYVRKAPAFTLTDIIAPEDCDKTGYSVVWTSSNEKVATVDEDGNVTTHHFGDAVITATLVDAEGNVVDTATCEVEVYYTFCQWLIWFFLLGCTWYFV